MIYLAVDKALNEFIFETCPFREDTYWMQGNGSCNELELPKGSIKKLIGRELTWEDDPVKLE